MGVRTTIETASGTAITSSLQPATNEFWISTESVPLASGGGWGSFTAAVLNFRDGFGKSYGTIGYESSTNTSYSAMGAAYNPKFYCTTAAVAGSCTAPYGSATSVVLVLLVLLLL